MPTPRQATRALRSFCLAGALVPSAALVSSAALAQQPEPDKAAQAYLAGARLVDRRNFAEAQAEFARAAALDPRHPEYARALALTRDQRIAELIRQSAQARLTNRPAEADRLLAAAGAIDPTNELVVEHAAAAGDALPAPGTRIAPADELRFAPPLRLTPTSETKTLHLRGDIRTAVTEAAKTFGIKTAFDDSVLPQQIKFDLDDTTYNQALPILLHVAHLFAVPVDATTILVAKDTQENRARLERLLEETIYVPGLTTEQLNELTNVVKNVFDIKQAVVSAALGTLVLRAPEPTLKAVNATLTDLLDGPAQVMLELKLITIDKSRTRNLGTTPPSSIGAFSVAAEAQRLVNANQSLLQNALSSGLLTLPSTNTAAQNTLLEALFLVYSGAVTDPLVTGLLTTVGNGISLLGINYTGTVAANFALNYSEARALDDLTVRVGDRQPTTLRVGEKYPITTATYASGLTSAQTSALAGRTIGGVSVGSLLASVSTSTVPQVQFEDLGLTLKTQPTVLKSGLISLHIDFKLEALTGASLDNIPILTSRAFTSDITVEDGSPAMMISDLSRTEQSSISGLPGLSELPGFQQSVSDTLRETDSSELVLLATPHLVRRRSNLSAGPRISFSTSVPTDF